MKPRSRERVDDSAIRAVAGRRVVRHHGLAVGLAILLLAVAPALASDPPHWSGAELSIDCTTQCHTPHSAKGGGLNPRTANENLCQSCHLPGGHASALPINEVDKAVRGVGGVHHPWMVCAVNAELSIQEPTDTEMKLRLMEDDVPCPEGYVVCSTCHDQHDSLSSFGGTPRISDAKKVAGSGGGTMTSGGTYTGATGYWYWVEIVDTSPSNRFCWARVDDDIDNPVEWCPAGSGCEGCDPDNSILTPNLDATGTQTLEAGVEVTFGGTPALGERWEFYAAWPFLRDEVNTGPDSGGNAFCINCHAAWQMTDTGPPDFPWNGSVRSHPVGVTIPTQNFHSPPLDGDGSAADGNPTNDLVLYGAGSDQVECLTCHGVHYVDSNTGTQDGPP